MQFNNCLIVGAGGTGQHLIPALIRLLKFHDNGTTNVTVYDGDDFEAHNIERQVADAGAKVTALCDALTQQGLHADLRHQYMNRNTLKAYLRRVDGPLLVIAAVDNDATRKEMIEVLDQTPGDFLFITPGNSDAADIETALKGNVLWFGREGSTPIGIAPTILFPNIEKPSDTIPRKGSCLEHQQSTPQLITANTLAAALTLTVVQNFLDDLMPSEASHCFFNGRTFSLTAN